LYAKRLEWHIGNVQAGFTEMKRSMASATDISTLGSSGEKWALIQLAISRKFEWTFAVSFVAALTFNIVVLLVFTFARILVRTIFTLFKQRLPPPAGESPTAKQFRII